MHSVSHGYKVRSATKVRVTFSIDTVKSKTRVIVPVDAGKAFDNTDCFKTEAFSKPGEEGNFLSVVQSTCETHALTSRFLSRARADRADCSHHFSSAWYWQF